MRDLKICSEADLRWRAAALLERRFASRTDSSKWKVNTELRVHLDGKDHIHDIVVHHEHTIRAIFELKISKENYVAHTSIGDDVAVLEKLAKGSENGPERLVCLYLHRASIDPYKPERKPWMRNNRFCYIPISVPDADMDGYATQWSFQNLT